MRCLRCRRFFLFESLSESLDDDDDDDDDEDDDDDDDEDEEEEDEPVSLLSLEQLSLEQLLIVDTLESDEELGRRDFFFFNDGTTDLDDLLRLSLSTFSFLAGGSPWLFFLTAGTLGILHSTIC